jgi:hypothetical protein
MNKIYSGMKLASMAKGAPDFKSAESIPSTDRSFFTLATYFEQIWSKRGETGNSEFKGH